MKKEELIKSLEKHGIKTEGKKWHELLQLKKEVDNPIEVKEKVLTESEKKKMVLAKKRKNLLPEIKNFIQGMKGKQAITKEETIIMFKLYNDYYERRDKPGCGTCTARIYNTLKKLI